MNTIFNRMEKINPAAEDVQMLDTNLTDQMKQQAEANSLVVRDKEGNQVSLDEGKQAFFALLAQDMLQLAEKYSKDIDEVHKLYY